MADLLLFIVIWVGTSLLAEWGLNHIKPHSMYDIISTQGVMAHNAFNFLSTYFVPIFLFIVVWLLFAIFRFRAADGRAVKSPRQTLGNPWFTGFWVIMSFALNILFWLHPTSSDLEAMFVAAEPANNRGDLVVNVTARQWEWIFSYPQYGIIQAVNAQGQDMLELPVGRKVKFVLRSYDPFHQYDVYAGVIHEFWIPAFGVKEDIIPGETRYEYTTPTQIANYSTSPMVRVQCGEVCGPGHPWMESPVQVVSPADFRRWIAAEKKLQTS